MPNDISGSRTPQANARRCHDLNPARQVSLAEKLEAMEALWADLSRTPADVPVPQWHRDVLKARLESPATWLDWEQVKASLREMARQ